jgi:hypothetical protein
LSNKQYQNFDMQLQLEWCSIETKIKRYNVSQGVTTKDIFVKLPQLSARPSSKWNLYKTSPHTTSISTSTLISLPHTTPKCPTEYKHSAYYGLKPYDHNAVASTPSSSLPSLETPQPAPHRTIP